MTLLIEEFQNIGKRLLGEGLVGANFGNMSVREKDGFTITRTGAFLDSPGETIFLPVDGEVPPNASSEYRVHREVYRITPHRAVVHAHPPHAVALSFNRKRIIPLDSEGEMFSPVIPVVTGAPGSMEMAQNVASALCGHKAVIVRGHGTFAGGKTLEEAFIITSIVEHSCRVLILSGK
jgi:L-fuculose-phosphate aldolase